jgi:hypothetical protein
MEVRLQRPSLGEQTVPTALMSGIPTVIPLVTRHPGTHLHWALLCIAVKSCRDPVGIPQVRELRPER